MVGITWHLCFVSVQQSTGSWQFVEKRNIIEHYEVHKGIYGCCICIVTDCTSAPNKATSEYVCVCERERNNKK